MTQITIAADDAVDQYAVGATPTTGPWTISYPYFSEDDIKVYVDGVLKTITTHYTISGTAVDDGFSGGTVTFVSPISSVTLTIERDVPIARTSDFPTAGIFNISTLNTTLDKLFAIGQQLSTKISRALSRPSTSAETYSLSWPDGFDTTERTIKVTTSGGIEVGPAVTDIDAASSNATAAAASAVAAAASETAAGVSETNAAASEAAAAAAAQGWADVVSITTGTTNIETTDANKYYILDASGGTITMNLPAVGTTDGLTLAFEVLDASNTITIARDGTDTINQVAGNYTSLTGVGDVVHFISIDGTPDDWSARLISRFVVDGATITQSGRTISVGALGVDTAQLAAEAVETAKIADANVTTAKIADDAVTPAKAEPALNRQTGSTYTFALTDNLQTVMGNSGSAQTFTIPTNASVAFGVDTTRIDVYMQGAGVVTVTGDTGVTVNGVSAGSGALAQYGACSLYKVATDTWLVVGLTVA